MKIVNQEAYDRAIEIPDGHDMAGYVKEIVRYSNSWADLMEEEIEKNQKSLKDIAKETSHTADTSGITGYMYNMAVQLLWEHWVYGRELLHWHNSEHGEQGEKANREGGIINSAILVVGTE